MAWMTAAGVYHGSLKVAEADSEDHIDNAQLLPYPSLPGLSSEDFPLSLSLTEFHFLLLFKDRIVGICNLNDHIAYEEQLPLVCLGMPIYHEQADDLYIYTYIFRNPMKPFSGCPRTPYVRRIGFSLISLFSKLSSAMKLAMSGRSILSKVNLIPHSGFPRLYHSFRSSFIHVHVLIMLAYRRRTNVIESWLLKLIRTSRKQDTFKLLDATRNAQRRLRKSCSNFWILGNVMP